MCKEVGLSTLLSVDDLRKTVENASILLKNFEENASGKNFVIKTLKLENGDVNADSNNFPFLQSINLLCNKRGASFIVIYIWFYCPCDSGLN